MKSAGNGKTYKKNPPDGGFVKIEINDGLVLNLAVKRVAAKKLVVFLFFDTFRLLLLVTSGHVAGNRLPLCAGFGAF